MGHPPTQAGLNHANAEVYRREERGFDVPRDAFVFCNPDGSAIKSFAYSFQNALETADILSGPDGKKRVPYSLRHTYATMRLSEGVRVFQLAANTGTSVEMIELFYG